MSSAGWLRRHLLLLLAILAYLAVAPGALFALPLAALLVATSLHSRQEMLTAAVAGGLSLVWLLKTGDLPDQLLRASAVIATVVFVTATRFTRAPVIHRAIVAVTTAAVVAGVLLLLMGSSWNEAHWWAEYRAGYVARITSQILWAIGDGSSTNAAQVDQVLRGFVRFQADYFPAMGALRILAGLALGTAIYHRVALRPYGPGLAGFRSFRFTEHLGWAAIVPLIVVLVPKLAAAKLGAANLLLFLGALYALRGVAVVAFGLQFMGAGSGLFVVFLVVAAILMLPLVPAGAILLGVVDSGLDLRRRWIKPPTD